MNNEDGGPAFPGFLVEGSGGEYSQVPYSGMSLRDYFAGQALAQMAHRWGDGYDESALERQHRELSDAKEVARMAYLYADAMLAARGPS